MTNADYISVEYRENAKDIDFSKAFADCQQKILYIHGKNDDVVPCASVNYEFGNKIIVENGDHYLSRPDMRAQWFGSAISFLTNRSLKL